MYRDISQADNEAGFLASILNSSDANELLSDACALGVCEACFLSAFHLQVFQAMEALSKSNVTIDIVTVADKLSDFVAINQLNSRAETSSHWKLFATNLFQTYHARILNRETVLMWERINNKEETLEEALPTLQKTIDEILNKSTKGEVSLSQDIDDFLTDLEQRVVNRGQFKGLETGFQELDNVFKGIDDGNLVILAGRPATGKTSLMMSIVENLVSARNPIPTLVFSFEMSKTELLRRLASQMAKVEAYKIKSGYVSSQDHANIIANMRKIKESKALYIIEDTSLNIDRMRGIARKMTRKYGIRLICTDYIQLIKSFDRKANRETQVSEISRGLKQMAQETKTISLTLAQLNRDSERENRPPRPSDLRESGSLEQDADIIMLLHNKLPKEQTDVMQIIDVDVNIAKNRHGNTPIIPLRFNKTYTRYETTTYITPPKQANFLDKSQPPRRRFDETEF